MTRRRSALPQARANRPVAFAGGLLALALAAGCGSSGTGRVVGAPPPPSTSVTPSPSPTDFPGPSSSPSETPSPSNDMTDYSDFGISLTVPDGYVIATTPAEAAERFPAVLGNGSDTQQKITDAQSRLRSNTIMIAFRAPINGLSDNIGLLRLAGQAPSDPTEIQSTAFQDQARTSLSSQAHAMDIQFTDTTIGGQPAEQVNYTITSASGTPVFGEQFYVAGTTDVFILTVTTGTADRTSSAADSIAGSWTFS